MTFIACSLLLFTSSLNHLLVTPQELAGMSDAVIVDSRTPEAFDTKHIPGAVNVDTSALSEERNGVPGLLRPLNEVTHALAIAGVDPNKEIVIYSGMENGRDIHLATRLFWILEYLGYSHVAVLDGGLANWEKQGHKTASGPVQTKPIENLKLTPHPEKLATTKQVAETMKDHNGVLLDLRGFGQYCGESQSGAVVRAGHIPTAQNLPALDILNPDHTFKSPDALKKLAQSKKIAPQTHVTTYCNTGRSASVGYFTMRLLGHQNVALYDGSMAEWTRDKNVPVETEKKAKEKATP